MSQVADPTRTFFDIYANGNTNNQTAGNTTTYTTTNVVNVER